MWGCLKLFVICWFVLFLMVYLSEDKPKEIKPIEAYKSPTPEPGREVYEFDWETHTYIYKDQVKPKKGKFKNYEPYPDMFVVGGFVSEDRKEKNDQIMTLDGVRYRVHKKPNGETQLIKIR